MSVVMCVRVSVYVVIVKLSSSEKFLGAVLCADQGQRAKLSLMVRI